LACIRLKSFLSWGVAPNPTRKLFAKSFLDFQKPCTKAFHAFVKKVFSPVFFKKLVGFGLKAQGLDLCRRFETGKPKGLPVLL